MNIIKLNSENRYYAEVINIYSKWDSLARGRSYEELYNFYKESLYSDNLPNIYVLISNDTLIGTYLLTNDDDIPDKKYKPYLANVYVNEYYRKRGFSEILIEDSKAKAKELGCKTLYLHSRIENYYEKYGFEMFTEIDTEFGKKRMYKFEIK